ncbi:MAG: zinc ribbon domain-containing protein [Deltaproteobacteria bacterium]|nr:zinc ribbon domain-containing protein [Deltaproteobacteria bacterium]
MPLFDFVCRSCGKEFEALVMGSSKPSCPDCKSKDLAKQMSVFAHRSGTDSSSSGGSGSGSACGGCTSSSCSTCH